MGGGGAPGTQDGAAVDDVLVGEPGPPRLGHPAGHSGEEPPSNFPPPPLFHNKWDQHRRHSRSPNEVDPSPSPNHHHIPSASRREGAQLVPACHPPSAWRGRRGLGASSPVNSCCRGGAPRGRGGDESQPPPRRGAVGAGDSGLEVRFLSKPLWNMTEGLFRLRNNTPGHQRKGRHGDARGRWRWGWNSNTTESLLVHERIAGKHWKVAEGHKHSYRNPWCEFPRDTGNQST